MTAACSCPKSRRGSPGLCTGCRAELAGKVDKLIETAGKAKGGRPKKVEGDSLAWVDMPRLAKLTAPGVRPLLAWMDQARCVVAGENMFPKATSEIDRVKREVCGRCPVIYECLSYTILSVAGSADHGVVGRTNMRERRRLRTRLKLWRLEQDRAAS